MSLRTSFFFTVRNLTSIDVIIGSGMVVELDERKVEG